VDSSQIVEGVHGLAEEQEDILVRTVDFAEAYRMIESNEIDSAIPILAIQWLALNKQKLQARWLA
jgi:ADP-ribose pyrophosphatase